MPDGLQYLLPTHHLKPVRPRVVVTTSRVRKISRVKRAWSLVLRLELLPPPHPEESRERPLHLLLSSQILKNKRQYDHISSWEKNSIINQ